MYLGALFWFIVTGWIAIQDNGAGRIENMAGLKWFGLKVVLVTVGTAGVLGIGSALIWLRDRLTN